MRRKAEPFTPDDGAAWIGRRQVERDSAESLTRATVRDVLKIAVTQEIINARDRGDAWPVDPDRILAAFNPAVLQTEG